MTKEELAIIIADHLDGLNKMVAIVSDVGRLVVVVDGSQTLFVEVQDE